MWLTERKHFSGLVSSLEMINDELKRIKVFHYEHNALKQKSSYTFVC